MNGRHDSLMLCATSIPQPWFEAKELQDFVQRCRFAAQRILLLDYDGTLAPFHVDKMQAVPYPGVVEALQRLQASPNVRIVLVTGRPAAELERLLDVAKTVELWGSHGREHITTDRRYVLHPPTVAQSDTLAAIQHDIEAALTDVALIADQTVRVASASERIARVGVAQPLERKPASLAIHWRGLADASRIRLRAAAFLAHKRHGNASIEQLPFESGVEFRAVGFSKGFAVNHVLSGAGPNDVVAYLGDDITDEDAFAALGQRGWPILVRPEIRASHAKYWLRSPDDLLRFLNAWGDPTG